MPKIKYHDNITYSCVIASLYRNTEVFVTYEDGSYEFKIISGTYYSYTIAHKRFKHLLDGWVWADKVCKSAETLIDAYALLISQTEELGLFASSVFDIAYDKYHQSKE